MWSSVRRSGLIVRSVYAAAGSGVSCFRCTSPQCTVNAQLVRGTGAGWRRRAGRCTTEVIDTPQRHKPTGDDHNTPGDTSRQATQPSHNAHDVHDVHTMYTRCTHEAHTMYTRCTHEVHTMYTRCTHEAHTMYTRCTHEAHTMYTRCTHEAHTMYTRCTHDVHTQGHNRRTPG
jgi:hypothetical protein